MPADTHALWKEKRRRQLSVFLFFTQRFCCEKQGREDRTEQSGKKASLPQYLRREEQ